MRLAAGLALVLLLTGATQGLGQESREAAVVELFTSQGCSSCPPADRLLRRLGEEAREGELAVAPLSFHVDYWNYIGWTDPFSSAEWSARQRRYGRGISGGRVYTPQMVIDGKREMVGSREAEVRQAISAATAERPRGRVSFTVDPSSVGTRNLVLDLEAAMPLGAAPVEVLVAVVEDGLSTPVGSGENGGKTLENDSVVRKLVTALEIDDGIVAEGRWRTGRRTVEIPLDPEWKLDEVGVVAFLQDPQTLEIHAGGVARLR